MPLRLTLTGLASQYIHMPLAPFCLKKAVDDTCPEVVTTICDLNINDTQEDLLHRVMVTQPDVLGISLYIWNRACAAQLILKCLEKGWYPSWDAANLWSVALAEKLGYHRGEEYMIYEIK